MAKKNFTMDLGNSVDTIKEAKALIPEEIKQQAEALPSPGRADLRAKLKNKVQMNFPSVPAYIKEMFQDAAKKEGMKNVEFLYHLMRQHGLDIPPYEQMDLRRG